MIVFTNNRYMQPVPITTKVLSSNPAHGDVYAIQRFVNDLRQLGGILPVLWFPPPIKIKLTATSITEILLNLALKTITLTLTKTGGEMKLAAFIKPMICIVYKSLIKLRYYVHISYGFHVVSYGFINKHYIFLGENCIVLLFYY